MNKNNNKKRGKNCKSPEPAETVPENLESRAIYAWTLFCNEFATSSQQQNMEDKIDIADKKVSFLRQRFKRVCFFVLC